MKLASLCLVAFLTSFVSMANPILKVTVTQIKKVKGTIEIGIYDKAEGFLDDGKQIKSISKKVTGKSITFTVELPKDGDYAVALYQDVNGDKKMNKNFLGIPKEPYGFSNVFKTVFSKPKFKKCKINTKLNKEIQIPLL